MKELIRRLVALALMTATREARLHLDLPDPESGGRNVSSNCYLRSFTTCAIYRADLPRVRKDASAFAGSTASSATLRGCVLVAGANQRAAGATARDRLSICETLLRSAGDMCVVVSICFGPTPGIVSSRLLVAFVPIVLVGTNMFGRITPRE